MTRSENFNQNANFQGLPTLPNLPTFETRPAANDEDDLVLPSVPDFGQGNDDLNASIEFDDLAKRFENLKSNKK